MLLVKEHVCAVSELKYTYLNIKMLLNHDIFVHECTKININYKGKILNVTVTSIQIFLIVFAKKPFCVRL